MRDVVQLPEYIKSEFPDFIKFVDLYFEFLNSAELIYSDSYLEFAVGDILTGQSSKSSTTVKAIDHDNSRIFVSKQNRLIIGETLSGDNGATAKISSYNPLPAQTIGSLLEYKNLDMTRSSLFDQYRSDFMAVIPNKLNKSIDVLNLVKNIKTLYTEKGTEASYKTLFLLLFNEYVEIYYPASDMLMISAGEWTDRYSIEVVTIDGNPLSLVGKDVLLNSTTAGSHTVFVQHIKRISFDRFEMHFKNILPEEFSTIGTTVNGVGFIGVLPETTITAYTGMYKDRKGFLSDSNNLQNKYYQKYSYAIRSNVVSDSYRSVIKGALHPAGLIPFDELIITNSMSLSDSLRVLKAKFIKDFTEGLDTLDNTLLDILKILSDPVNADDLYSMSINKPISGDTIGFSHIQYFDLNPYATDYFYQPTTYTDSGI